MFGYYEFADRDARVFTGVPTAYGVFCDRLLYGVFCDRLLHNMFYNDPKKRVVMTGAELAVAIAEMIAAEKSAQPS